MAKKQQSSISTTFISFVEDLSDKAQIKAGFEDLRKQITAMAEAMLADKNVIIAHSRLNMAGEEPGLDSPVDSKLVELQTINAKVEKGKSVAVDPDYKPKFKVEKEEEVEEPEAKAKSDEDEFFDKPRVTAGYWTPPIPKSKPLASTAQSTTPAQITTARPDKAKVVDAIFNDLKKSAKSSAIVDYLIDNQGKELTPSDIAKGAKIEGAAANIWLTTTGKQIKALKNVSRGVYTFDVTKIKIKD